MRRLGWSGVAGVVVVASLLHLAPDVSPGGAPASVAHDRAAQRSAALGRLTAEGTPAAGLVALSPCTDALVCGDDLAAALDLEQRIADNIWYGQVLEIDYRTADRTLGDVASIGAWGDSGLWTGTYLAGESYRYAVARGALVSGGLDAAGVTFWEAQQAEAKARVDDLVAKYHLNINIARGWRTELGPAVDPATPSVGYGGGIIQGEEGMLMRSSAPADAPPGRNMGVNKRVFGPFPWEDGKEYLCETAPSRDTYTGTLFGLLTAFDVVGPDDPDMQRLIADDVRKLGEFLLKYGWSFPRPHGNANIPAGEQRNPITGERLPLFGHDFDGVLSPLFVYVPSARLNMTQSVRHVTKVSGPTDAAAKWEAVWAAELASQGPLLAGAAEIEAIEPNVGYYKFNLNHLVLFNTLRLEADRDVRSLFGRAFGVMDAVTGDDINAHFEAITHAVTGEQARLDASVQHLRDWLGYRHNIHLGPVDNSPGCGVEFDCVPEDEVTAQLGAQQTTVRPGTSGKRRADLPLPVATRPPTDFLWQRAPTVLTGSESATHQSPGVDYLLPYWMLRYFSEVETPLGEPFPAWPGPSYH